MSKKIHISSHSNIESIKPQWLILDKAAENISADYINYTYYQTYEWNNFLFHHSTDGFGKLTTAMRYDLIMVDDKPFAIIPFAITRSSKKARIPSCRVGGVLNMACPYTYEGNEDIMAAIAKHLTTSCKGMTLSLADVPCQTPFAKIMNIIDQHPIERTSFHVPLTLFKTHEEYVASLPKNIYKNIRKSYNHLTTDGKEMKLRVFTHSNMASDGYLRYLWHFYFKRKMAWRHKSYNALSNITTYLKALYEVKSGCATASLKKLKKAELYTLEIDGKAAAFMIVYRHNKHLLMPRLAIDTTFSRYSPGILLILEATKLWINEGIVDFDMCRGDERYKKEMGGINEPLCRIERHLD